MQERKNKRLFILFCALCCMTIVVYWAGNNDRTVDIDKNLFKDYNLKAIDQVTLDSKKSRVELKFNGTRWVVNNQFDADAAMIEVLFATLQQVEPKRPLAAAIQDSVSNAIKQEGVRVTLSSSGEVESTFYAGGNEQKTQAYFYTENGERKSYLVGIPGYRVYASGIFELPEKDWKNKYVFGFNWRNFERLEAKFPEKPADNFEVALQDNYFSVLGLLTVDTAKLNNFLDDVSLLTVDEYVNQPIFDSISKPLPLMTLTVKDIGQRAYTLEIYNPQEKQEKRVPGLINGIHWAYFNPTKLQGIIKRRTFFGK
jgi:hypothetical protein